MTIHFGSVPQNSTLYVPFATFNAAGASVTISGLAVTDIEIYKNGSVTQRASDAGYALLDTDGTDFDGITGIHGFSVDLSDNSDASFYTVGAQFWIVVSAITADSQTVNFVAATFRIGPAEDSAGFPKVTIKNGTGTGELALTSGNVALTTAGNTAVVDALYASVAENNGSITFKAWCRHVLAACVGRSNNSGNTVTHSTPNNAKVRITTVTDATNSRTSVTLDGTD